MTREELGELRRGWALAATFKEVGGRPVPCGCWFKSALGIGNVGHCEGRIQGCHFLKRQRVEKVMAAALGLPEQVTSAKWQRSWNTFPAEYPNLNLLFLAAWDPRNSVAGCERHHQRFDGQRMPPLVVPRLQVPKRVVYFTLAWGLETQLEDRCPEEA